jgi:hypothetical protein
MTRRSMLETATDLDVDLANVALVRSRALWETIVFEGVDPANPWHRMWDGYETALAAYALAIGSGLAARGVDVFRTTEPLFRSLDDLRREGYDYDFVRPPWMDDLDFIRSHRSNLSRRFPDRFEWKGTPAKMPYLWPFVDAEGGYGLFLSKHDKTLLSRGERTLPSKIAERIENL